MEVVGPGVVAERLRALRMAEPRVVVGGNFATPCELVRLLDENIERCRAFVLNPQRGWPSREGFVTETPFVGPGVRESQELDYLPMRLSLVPRLFTQMRPPDVVLVQTSKPRAGKLSLGVEVNILPAAIEQVRRRGGLVIAQVNSHMPYTRGDAEIDLNEFDLALEVDEPLISPARRDVEEDDVLIGERVASLASDGGTIQMGIGQLPDSALAHMHMRRNLGVWSECISDGVMALQQANVLDADRDIIASFMFGSPELYEWADRNAHVVMRRTEVVNDPAKISANPSMLSINTAIEVDLYAQANASYVRGVIYSGFGGQPDFVIGALHSKGGHAAICLRSWHKKADCSTIVPMLKQPVCSFQHSHVITEQGMASILGHSQHAQARVLIEEAAHPRAREALWEAAAALHLARPVATV